MVGLGLAIARPDRRVLVVTGDGEMLMGLGALATIGVQRPPNLAIAVFDNGHYGETGMQASHTDGRRSSWSRRARLRHQGDFRHHRRTRTARLRRPDPQCIDATLFARVAIRADEPPRVLPPRDGVYLKNRFRRAIGVGSLTSPRSAGVTCQEIHSNEGRWLFCRSPLLEEDRREHRIPAAVPLYRSRSDPCPRRADRGAPARRLGRQRHQDRAAAATTAAT